MSEGITPASVVGASPVRGGAVAFIFVTFCWICSHSA
jgi:hypothetical protein